MITRALLVLAPSGRWILLNPNTTEDRAQKIAMAVGPGRYRLQTSHGAIVQEFTIAADGSQATT